jgi:hypothetical protein
MPKDPPTDRELADWSEHEFMRRIIEHAIQRGWGEPVEAGMTPVEKATLLRPYHTHIAKRGANGFPDLLMVRRGRMVIAELKREKGSRVAPAQQKWLDALALVAANTPMVERGYRAIEVYLWRPSDWATIVKVLR